MIHISWRNPLSGTVCAIISGIASLALAGCSPPSNEAVSSSSSQGEIIGASASSQATTPDDRPVERGATPASEADHHASAPCGVPTQLPGYEQRDPTPNGLGGHWVPGPVIVTPCAAVPVAAVPVAAEPVAAEPVAVSVQAATAVAASAAPDDPSASR